MAEPTGNEEIATLTADIVSAYLSTNTVTAGDVPKLIESVSAALHEAAHKSAQPLAEKPTPAVPLKKSVTPDYIICLEDGKKFKSLKRHIRTKYDLTPDEYREMWSLPHDYPMVAPSYAAKRSAMAKKIGLGKKRKR